MHQIAHNGRNVDLKSGEDRGWNHKLEVHYFVERLRRINKYFEALIKSFDIMVDGMEKGQFLRFRMVLLPASGFQSAQYRRIEICAADFINLVVNDKRAEYRNNDASIEAMYNNIYWKEGAMELATRQKTLTLKHFEKKYSQGLIELANQYKDRNLWQKYRGMSTVDRENQKLKNALKQLDVNVNVNWPLVHYKSTVRYLGKDTEKIAATGGTNWQKYLPPRFQKRIFYPSLWSEKEKKEWGKTWVESLDPSG